MTPLDKEIVARRRAGEKPRDIAKDLGLTYVLVTTCIRTHAPEFHRPHPTPEQRQGVLQRLKAGEDIDVVAADTGFHKTTLYLWLRTGGGSRVPVDREMVIRQFTTGAYTLEALGVQHGVSRERIRQIVTEAGKPQRVQIQLEQVSPQVNTVRLRYMRGDAPADIARDLEITTAAVRRIVKHCPKPDLREENRTFDYDAMIADYRTGAYTTGALGQKYGTVQTNITAVLYRHAPDTLAQMCEERRRYIPLDLRAKVVDMKTLFDPDAVNAWLTTSGETPSQLARRCRVPVGTIYAIKKKKR